MPLTPTTTLTIETQDNTSTTDSFRGTYTGNNAASNISKVPYSTLLKGRNVPVFHHLMPWWHKDGTSHPMGKDVGYDSTDPAQIALQCLDIISRGGTGVIIDWYGRPQSSGKKWEDDATRNWFNEAAKHSAFKVCVMLDAGAYREATDKTQEFIGDANYCAGGYFAHPSYWRINGRPVFPSFGDSAYNLDWHRIRSEVHGSPLYIFRNAGGATHAESDGLYSWTSLDDVIASAKAHPNKLFIASVWPGFDDRLASWGKNRIIERRQGQLWLECWAKINAALDAGVKIAAIQIVTHNDYEEGTAVEPGVDASLDVGMLMVRDEVLSWSVSGNLSALDHINVYVSPNGEGLTKIGDALPSTARGITLPKLDPGNYKLFVKAVGKPSIKNAMSPAFQYIINAPVSPTVIINAPKEGMILPNPVSINATSSVVGRMECWVDGHKVAEYGGSTLITSRPMTQGPHKITVQAVSNSDGKVLAKAIVNVTVK